MFIIFLLFVLFVIFLVKTSKKTNEEINGYNFLISMMTGTIMMMPVTKSGSV